MKIRADFSQRVVVRPGEADWTPSPQPGVDRLMLDRIGEEIARATSLVRFSPGSFFPFHEHGGGEEVFVVDGVFEDEYGRYPAGTYLRDPIGSSHAPFTQDGCTLFVKLWQFAPGDKERVVIDTASSAWEQTATPGVAVKPLHSFAGVSTLLIQLAPGLRLNRPLNPGGEEILVLEGAFADGEGEYSKGAWIRDPGGREAAIVSQAGCVLFVKAGHLPPDLGALQDFALAQPAR
ncbi:cupin domain-containing protein [Methylocapsa polymorpha]|uniref:Cupin domain-containing protein n=1 Tax=Methylocapsa polymorpha TaxID=3080828 RepID=A0ABZ0HQS3_9HYPH|nr:cupin domain-containing protein [Methylocapsa sp. RX1]